MSASASIGGIPRPAWIRIGTFASAAASKIESHLRGVEAKPLRAWMYRASRAEPKTALRFGKRIISRIEAAVRDDPSATLDAHASTRSFGVR